LEHGLYTFTLPDSGAAEYRDCFRLYGFPNNFQATPLTAYFHWDNIGYVNCMVLKDLSDTTTNASSTMAVTLDRHNEFRASSVLFPLGFSSTTLEVYHAAQMALVQQGVFYENPSHLGEIGALIGSAVRRYAPLAAPYVVKGARMAADKLLAYANNKLGQMVQSAPGSQQQKKRRSKPTRPKVAKRAAKGRKGK
jgi:hypothetical protein